MKLRGELTDDHRRVPMCVINGDLEHERLVLRELIDAAKNQSMQAIG